MWESTDFVLPRTAKEAQFESAEQVTRIPVCKTAFPLPTRQSKSVSFLAYTAQHGPVPPGTERFSTSDDSQAVGGLWGYSTRVLGGVFKTAVPPSLPALLPPPFARIQRPDSRSRCGPSYAAAGAAVVAARGARPPLLRATLGLRHSGTCRW